MADGRDEARQKDRTSNKYAAKKAASERLAAQRAAQQRSARNRNILIVGTSTIAVIAVIVVIVVVGVSQHKSGTSATVSPATSAVTGPLASAATSTLTSATNPDFSTLSGPPTKITADPLKGSSGKPEVLYVGAEYCPYCAATRWPLALALSRFGTFSDLQTTYSSSTDVDPRTPTLSFHKSSYTSQYVDFVPKEQQDGAGKPLEELTAAENTLFTKYGTSPGQSGPGYPFIDFGNTWVQRGVSMDPALLKGMTPEEVAKTLGDTSSKQGKAIQAGADVFTAIICQLTNGQPSNVCTAAGVQKADTAINGK